MKLRFFLVFFVVFFAGKAFCGIIGDPPKPVVDTVKHEGEKYGNDGGFVRRFGLVLLQGTQGISAKVGRTIQGKSDGVQSGSKRLTAFLNRIGHELVGLR